MTTFPLVDDFPVFSQPFYGLKKLNNVDKANYAQMIKDFNEIVRNQPPFLITKESWNILAEGKHPNGSDWKNSDYEVYAFVFCVAFDKLNLSEIKLGKPSAYFRVRTILKKRNAKIKTGITPAVWEEPVLVEANYIAYVSLDIALKNQATGGTETCLVFNKDVNSQLQAKIDREVLVKPNKVTDKNPYNHDIPLGFQDPNVVLPKPNSIIKNEGCIFGKQGIWDALLGFNGKYRFQNDTLISLAWNKKKQHIIFDFKINDEYGALRDCPNPPVCPKE